MTERVRFAITAAIPAASVAAGYSYPVPLNAVTGRGELPQWYHELRAGDESLVMALGDDPAHAVAPALYRANVETFLKQRHHPRVANTIVPVQVMVGPFPSAGWARLVPTAPGVLGIEGEDLDVRLFVHAVRLLDSYRLPAGNGFRVHAGMGPHPLPMDAAEIVGAGKRGTWHAVLPDEAAPDQPESEPQPAEANP